MEQAIGEAVRDRVIGCLKHTSDLQILAAALNEPQAGERVVDAFAITAAEALGDELVRYQFRFTDLSEPSIIAHTFEERHRLHTPVREGWIVLDKDLHLMRDEAGRARIGPWTCNVPPEAADG